MNSRRFFSLLLVFCIALSAYGYDWVLQNPWPSPHHLLDMDFVNSNTGYAVGYAGEILKTTDGGTNWISLRQPDMVQWDRVQFISEQEGWLFGTDYNPGGACRHTTDGGLTWEPIAPNYLYQLISGRFVDSQNGWAADGSYLYHTTDGGSNWQTVTPAAMVSTADVAFADSLHGWIVGFDHSDSLAVIGRTEDGGAGWDFFPLGSSYWTLGTVNFTDLENGWVVYSGLDSSAWHTTNGGDTWTQVIPPDSSYMQRLWFRDALDGWMITGYHVYHTTDGGATWRTFTNIGLSWPGDVYATDESTVYITGDMGRILKTVNGGNSWIELSRGSHNTLSSVAFLNDQEGFAGSYGSLLHTTDGGRHWQEESSGPYYAYSIGFADASSGWSVGPRGDLYRTTNAGQSWARQTTDSDCNLFSLSVRSANNAWACGYFRNYPLADTCRSAIIHTGNGGQTWQTQYAALDSGLLKMDMPSNSEGWAIGYSDLVLHTSDGGANWLPQTVGTPDMNFSDVDFVDPQHGWLIGWTENSPTCFALRTSDGGQHWDTSPIPDVYGESQIKFLDILTGYLLSECCGSQAIYYTNDGGYSWNAMTSEASVRFTNMFFLNDHTGWIVGDGGTILKFSGANSAQTSPAIARSLELGAYPNPFNSSTRLRFNLNRSGNITLSIMNILGQKVATLVDAPMAAGNHETLWNASGFSSGIYFAVLNAGTQQKVQKIVLMK